MSRALIAAVLFSAACVHVTREVDLDRTGPAQHRLRVERNTLPDRDAPSLSGSLWMLEAELPKTGAVRYELLFLEGGALESRSPRDRTPDDDTWRQQGATVSFRMNDGFCVYEGVFVTPDRIEGEALNVREEAWAWTLTRVEPGW
ncbi:MAG: hypothetical protein H6739_37625 [Alphaproteobacteria bacterium]|nr:hypothetical protein [Alphaproteobacteria bacterium]